MRITRLVSISLLVAATALTGCKKDKKEEGSSTGKTQEAAKGGVRELSAPDFYKDFNSLQGMEVLEKYADGVIVSGTVLRTIEEGDGSLVVWLDSGNGTWVSLGFTDSGQAAKDKGVKAGDTVKAKCDVGGSDGEKYVMNIDCTLS